MLGNSIDTQCMVVIQWHISSLTYVCPNFIGVYSSVTWLWKLANLNIGFDDID
jgi:hypothetical protein